MDDILYTIYFYQIFYQTYQTIIFKKKSISIYIRTKNNQGNNNIKLYT